MRVWDISPEVLCNKHLVAQHHEIHCIWSIITRNKKGFAHHPEVMRWRDCIGGLLAKHGETTVIMNLRGINHNSPIGAEGFFYIVLPPPWQSVEKQIEILKSKNCGCKANL